MAYKFKQEFNKGVNLDIDEVHLPPDAVQFIKNMTAEVNQNPGASSQAGANMGTRTPLEGNVELSITLPDGDNFCVGFYSSEQTNEGYFFVYNSLGNHSIWVIYGNDGMVDFVYEGSLLPFVLDPAYFISTGRCTLQIKSYLNPINGRETNFKFLIFTNGLERQYFISVQDSIDTVFYSTPYFTTTAAFYEESTLIHLGVPTPMSCIGVTAIDPAPEDLQKQTQVARIGFQFRAKFIDVFGRESVHGIISNVFATAYGGGCIDASNGGPRCLELVFDGGNPLVDYIQIEYRKWIGNDTGGALETNWIKYDTFSKWIHAPGQKWFQRFPNTGYYDVSDNSITYTFCADKNCQPIPVEETQMVEPGLPRLSNTVFSPDKRLALANNVRGFENIDPAELAKIALSTVPPSEDVCAPVMRTLIVYANIYRPFNDASGLIRGSHGKIVWGSEDGDCTGPAGSANSFRVDQVFGDQENPGFIFYFAGTPFYCITEWGSLFLASGDFIPNPTYSLPPIGYEPMCRIKITAPAGKYVLRCASHKAKFYDPNYQNTSTYVAGYCDLAAAFFPSGANTRRHYADHPIKELEIDLTSGDVTYSNPSDPMFVILDTSGADASPIDGYLYESPDSNTPIEMNPIGARPGSGSGDCYGSYFTDHNGFFFATNHGGDLYLMVPLNVCGTWDFVISIYNADTKIKHADGAGFTPGACGGEGNYLNRVYVSGPGSAIPTYPDAARRHIIQKITLCDAETGVSQMPVVMTKGASGLTDSATGTVTLIAHNRYDYLAVTPFTDPDGDFFLFPLTGLPDYSTSPNADDVLVFTGRGLCRWVGCSTCDPFISDATVVYDSCGGTRTRTLHVVSVNIVAAGNKGVQSGGRYSVGIIAFDEIDRATFVQVQDLDASLINMPNLNDPTYLMFALSSIAYTIDPSFTLPAVFKKMTFAVSENTLFSDFFSWAADYIQLVDNTGVTNTVNPTKIRIYYGSLNEYKKLNNFTVNCNWQFQTTGTDTQGNPVVGDVVQFIKNGISSPDTTAGWFDSVISAPVTYDNVGLFFTIDFQEELRNLTNGSLFRVIRPKTCQTNYLYYEQCMVIDLVNGMVPSDKLTGTLPYFDSYILSRLLPVPILQGQPGAIAPGATPINPLQYTNTNLDNTLESEGYATQNVGNNNGTLIMSVNDALTVFPFYFESPSPSDFWGSHMSNRGRTFSANPYAAQTRIGTEVALSAAFSERGVLNGLSYFENKNVYTFNRNTWGTITAVLLEVNRCLFICDSDHFFSDFNNTQLQVNDTGGVEAQNQLGPFTSPRRPAGTPYGCLQKNINTIQQYQGKVVWLDAEGRLIINDFNESKDVSTYDPQKGIIGGYSGYLMNKISTANVINSDPGNVMYFVAGIDPRTNEYYLTAFRLLGTSFGFARSYLNILPDMNLNANETIIVDVATGMLKGTASFTQEMYGNVPGYISGRNFFSFKAASPWRHHAGASGDVIAYAHFNGSQCPCYITPVVNVEGETVKRFLWIEIYTKYCVPGTPGTQSGALFYCQQIESEKGQISRLLAEQFLIRNNFQCAAYLCDLNTPFDSNKPIPTTTHAITDGDQLIGRWLKVLIKTNDNWTGTYFEVSGIINGLNGVQISGEK